MFRLRAEGDRTRRYVINSTKVGEKIQIQRVAENIL